MRLCIATATCKVYEKRKRNICKNFYGNENLSAAVAYSVILWLGQRHDELCAGDLVLFAVGFGAEDFTFDGVHLCACIFGRTGTSGSWEKSRGKQSGYAGVAG